MKTRFIFTMKTRFILLVALFAFVSTTTVSAALISRMLGLKNTPNLQQTIPVEQTTQQVVQPQQTKVWRVGDYYNENGKEGVVFEVSANGRHGKIVSVKESFQLQWSSDENEQRRLIGADNENDGSKNMAKVMQIPAWRDKYPAFAWCASLGEGWYLPAKKELKTIYRVKNKLNNTLADEGEKIRGHWHWSSTEDDHQDKKSGRFCAWYVLMRGGNSYCFDKSFNGYVRAVSAF